MKDLSLGLLFILISLFSASRASAALRLDESKASYDLSSDAELWLDPSDQTWTTHEQVPASAKFAGFADQDLRRLGAGTAWMRVVLDNDRSYEQSWVLYSDYFLYPLQIYREREGRLVLEGEIRAQPQGQALDRYLGSLMYTVRIPARSQEHLYLVFKRAVPKSSLSFWLHTPERMQDIAKFEQASRYLILGITLAMLIFHALASSAIGQRHQVYYRAYLAVFALNFALVHQLFLAWIQNDTLYQLFPYAVAVTTDASYFFASLFTYAFLNLKRSDPLMSRLIRGSFWVFGFEMLVALVSPELDGTLRRYTSLIFGPLLLMAGLRSMRRGYSPARFYTLGWGLLITANCIWILSGVLDFGNAQMIDWIVPYGVVVEIFILMAALSERLRLEQKEARERFEQLQASLESKVAEQTRNIRNLLDNTHLGLLAVGESMRIHRDYSKHLEQLFECPTLSEQSIWDVLFAKAQMTSEDLARSRCALEYSLGDDIMFYEANAPILPQRVQVSLKAGLRILDLDWSAVADSQGRVERVLLGVTDVTDKVQAQKVVEEQARRLQSLAEILQGGAGNFQRIARELESICQEFEQHKETPKSDLRKLFIRLHTLKSRTRMENYTGLTGIMHELEELLTFKNGKQKMEHLALETSVAMARDLIQQYQESIITLEQFKHEKVLPFASKQPLKAFLLSFEPMLRELCRELSKVSCSLQVSVPDDLVLEGDVIEALRTALLHSLRNTVDHGLETLEERIQAGKSQVACLEIKLTEQGSLIIKDDGRGIQLDKIRSKAHELGLSFADDGELANLIFLSGLSTKEQTDEISGRGIGMDAVRTALRDLGGDAWIELLEPASGQDRRAFHLVIQLPQKTWQENVA